jgi:hypothetical protein
MTAEEIEGLSVLLTWIGCGILSIIECLIAHRCNPIEAPAIWDNRYYTLPPKVLKFSLLSLMFIAAGGAGFVVCTVYLCVHVWTYFIRRDLQSRNIQSPSPEVPSIESSTDPFAVDWSQRMRDWMRRQSQEMIRREQEERLDDLQEEQEREEWIKNGCPQKPIIPEEKTNRFGIMEIE